jgi:hypothetical protein
MSLAPKSKEVFIPCRGERPVFPGFVTYVSASEPTLLHRFGWVDFSDGYDDFADSFSQDNGRTWTEPVLRQKSYEVPEGRVRYAENAAFFDADLRKLLTFTSRGLYPKDTVDVDANFEVVFAVFDPATGQYGEEAVLPFELPGGLAISFCFPIKTSRGNLLVPAMTKVLDNEGRPVHYQGCWAPVEQPITIIGDYQADGTLQWRLGGRVPVNVEQNSRGLSENTLAELRDGRIAMISRGDNSMFPERPGYKWLCFSEDDGETWDEPVPLPCDTGDPIESGSNGSALFRSIWNGRLYWMGNLALDGRANANWPRTPIVIAEVQEEPFALKRETITIVDQRAPHEHEHVQMSNFRFYQDRENGDVVVFLARYGERDLEKWYLADYYRYRVSL